MNFKKTTIAWGVFLLGTIVIYFADYISRIFFKGGLPSLALDIFPILFLLVFIYFLWLSTNHCKNLLQRLLIIGMQIMIAIAILFWITVEYVCETGIECF